MGKVRLLLQGQPQGSDYPPILNAHEIGEPFGEFEITGAGGPVPVRAFGQSHGRIRSLGFRFGPLAYSQRRGRAGRGRLRGAGRRGMLDRGCAAPHTRIPAMPIWRARLEWIARVGPARAVLTNMHVDMDYETLRRELPAGVEPAYDGMTLAV